MKITGLNLNCWSVYPVGNFRPFVEGRFCSFYNSRSNYGSFGARRFIKSSYFQQRPPFTPPLLYDDPSEVFTLKNPAENTPTTATFESAPLAQMFRVTRATPNTGASRTNRIARCVWTNAQLQSSCRNIRIRQSFMTSQNCTCGSSLRQTSLGTSNNRSEWISPINRCVCGTTHNERIRCNNKIVIRRRHVWRLFGALILRGLFAELETYIFRRRSTSSNGITMREITSITARWAN